MPDIPALSRFDRRVPQHLKFANLFFCANPKLYGPEIFYQVYHEFTFVGNVLVAGFSILDSRYSMLGTRNP
jgi:hypothetical protein